jgi:hypothetical protein
MRSKISKTSVAIALGVAFAVAFSAVGFASSSQGSGHTRQLKVFSVETAATQVDVDGDGAFSVGDEVIGQANDYDKPHGTQIGTGTFVCVAMNATTGDFDCQGSDVLQGGEIREAGRLLGSDPLHLRWAITGGSGSYLGVSGQIEGTFTDATQAQANITFTLVRH